jgi:hypothetical protein
MTVIGYNFITIPQYSASKRKIINIRAIYSGEVKKFPTLQTNLIVREI